MSVVDVVIIGYVKLGNITLYVAKPIDVSYT